MSDWFNTGWDAVDETYEEIGRRQAENDSRSNGNGGDNKPRGPFRVRLRGPKFENKRLVREGETRRYMILDPAPASLHEHRYKSYREDGTIEWNNYEPCKKKQALPGYKKGDDCAICIRYEKNYPYYVGLHTAMSLTPYFSESGYEWMFNRYILAARLGSPKRPGMLKRLQRLAQQHNNGSMRGMVIECHRRGEKSEIIGDEIDCIEVIPEDQILNWARPRIAEFVERVNDKIRDPEKHLSVNRVLERDPWVPFDWGKIIKVHSNEELFAKIGRSSGSSGSSGSSRPQSNGYGGGYGQSENDPGGYRDDPGPSQQDFLDDDIPF